MAIGCQPRLTLSARDLHHRKQQVSPFSRDLFRLRKLGSDLHERNVDEMLAQSRLQLGARDFHNGKQQVSPFYRISQLLHEKKVIRFPENGALLFEGKQQVSPFYHDLGLDLVGLIGNFLLVAQLLLQVVEQLLYESKSFIQSCFKEIFGGSRGDAFFLLVFDFSSFHPNNFRGEISWECFVKNDSVRSCVIETSILSVDQVVFRPNTPYFDVSSMLCACIVHDAVLPSRSCQDPCVRCPVGSTGRKNTLCLLLKICPPGINPELMMECKLTAHPT